MGWESLIPALQVPTGTEGISALKTGFDTGKAIYDTNILRQAGQLASQGDWNGASQAALAGGNLDAGIKLQSLPIERQTQAYDLMGRAAQAAKTPEQWAELHDTMTRLFGPDSMKGFETINSRQRAIDLATTAKEKALLAIEQQKANAESLTAAAHMKTATVAEQTAKQWQALPGIPGAMFNPPTGKMMMPDGSVIDPQTGYQPAPGANGASVSPAAGNPFYWLKEAETAKKGAEEDAKLSSERAGKTVDMANSAKTVVNKIDEAEEILNSPNGQKLVGTIQGRPGMIALRSVLGDKDASRAQQQLHEILAVLNAENSKMMFPGQRQTDSDLRLAQLANGSTDLTDTQTLKNIMGYLRERAQDSLTMRKLYELPGGQKIAESADFNPRTFRKNIEAGMSPAQAAVAKTIVATPQNRPGTQNNPAAPTTVQEFNSLPIGTWYRNTDGRILQKSRNIEAPAQGAQ